LYNLDGTFYKTILMPPRPDSTSFFYSIDYISESLFDNDPSTIEYIVAYTYDSIPGNGYYKYNRVKVIREDGTILLDEMNADGYYVYSTEEGTKLMLYYEYANFLQYQTKVFNLPGKIPFGTDDKITDMPNYPVLYPNPNNGSFFIRFHSNGENDHQIELYSTTGKLIDTYKSFSNPTHINNLNLSEGEYLINTRSKGNNSTTKMIIKK
jgi:outer membrane protein assembly factor BamB